MVVGIRTHVVDAGDRALPELEHPLRTVTLAGEGLDLGFASTQDLLILDDVGHHLENTDGQLLLALSKGQLCQGIAVGGFTVGRVLVTDISGWLTVMVLRG
jgi:hypothetical protein